MDRPKIAHKGPAVLTLDPGTYWWCRCGLSLKQPFCDGAHKGTALKPLMLEVKERREVALCQCKATDNPPCCDGTHKKL